MSEDSEETLELPSSFSYKLETGQLVYEVSKTNAPRARPVGNSPPKKVSNRTMSHHLMNELTWATETTHDPS